MPPWKVWYEFVLFTKIKAQFLVYIDVGNTQTLYNLDQKTMWLHMIIL